MRTYLIAAIALTLNLGSCIDKRAVPVPLDTRLVGRPIVPKNIVWNSLDDRYEARLDQYSKFRTYYFAWDSTVFAFDCINDKKVICRDTSIYDPKSKLYNDTSICAHEDSILFAVENVEMQKGTYRSTEGQVICKMPGSYDTLRITGRGDTIALLSNGQSYVPATNFKKESYRRLFELMGSGSVGSEVSGQRVLYDEEYDSVINDKIQINGVFLSGTKQDILRQIGKPDKITKYVSDANDDQWYEYHYGRTILQVLFNGRFYGFELKTKAFTWRYGADTVRVGDPLSLLCKYFPASCRTMKAEKGEMLRVRCQGTDGFIHFVTENNIVTSIETWQDI
jgi:hypothetical protein